MRNVLLAAVVLMSAVSVWAQDGTMMKAEGSMMKAEGSMMKSETMDSSAYDLQGLGKQVVAFTSEKDAQMAAQSQTVVYFFAATWCPDCQATYKDLRANFAKLPMGFQLVFVNYDKSSELKKKYGITMQHTFVLLGPHGEKRKVWVGSSTVADIVKKSTMM